MSERKWPASPCMIDAALEACPMCGGEARCANYIVEACAYCGDCGLKITRQHDRNDDGVDAVIAAWNLRTLSRGVPEGKDGERYRYLCDRHPLKMQRWLVGEVAEGKIDRKDLIDAAVDEQMARDYAASAAQRKEGN